MTVLTPYALERLLRWCSILLLLAAKLIFAVLKICTDGELSPVLMKILADHIWAVFFSDLLCLTFLRAKLRRQIFMTRAEVWAKSWAKYSAHFRASICCAETTTNLLPNSSQFITPCLVAEISKFHFRKLRGFGGHKICSHTSSLERQVFWGSCSEC